jgi:hypothetical protein
MENLCRSPTLFTNGERSILLILSLTFSLPHPFLLKYPIYPVSCQGCLPCLITPEWRDQGDQLSSSKEKAPTFTAGIFMIGGGVVVLLDFGRVIAYL